ncbi:MAG TPA: hypothetical protein VMD91_00890 [Candidatus Sulfotelmatobacter sp.]|nr:hypothetical protein [Candidatus Sulfotelmatobacter sp.]
MRRFPVTWLILIVVVVGAVVGWRIFFPLESARYASVQQVRHERSIFHVSETIAHAKGPLAREVWRLDNVDGRSSASYSAENRAGTRVAKFTTPVTGYDVTFAFEALVRDGVWQLTNRPYRGNTDNVYTVSVEQRIGDRGGSRTFSFTDPHYLATTAGRQYEIHLDKNKPVPDLLTLQSTSTADPRYQKVVDDFASFGPPGFRQTVATARKKLLAS